MPPKGVTLRVGVAGLALAGLLVSATATGARQPAPALVREYRAAARSYGVPAPLLLAIGYVNTRWRMPPTPGRDGGWGPMHLGGRRLALAARLTGVDARRLARDRAQNVRGGAVLLRHLAGNRRPESLAAWRPHVAKLGGAVFAEQVYATLALGARARVGGETIVLAPRTPPSRTLAAAAYGRAEYAAAFWRRAHPANYRVANRPASTPITRIVIHTTEGSYGGTISWFRNPASGVSTHYVIRSSDGEVTQMVAEKDVGIHAGNNAYNFTTIGIEHEAFVSNCSWYTDAMYRSSARLVAYLALKYAIPLDRGHVIGHGEVPDPRNPRRRGGAGHHTDPGRCWDWTKYMTLVREYAGRSDEAIVDDGARRRFRAPGWRVVGRSPQRYGRSYALARPSAKAAPATFRVRIPVTGDYAVYAWWPAYPGSNRSVPIRVDTATGLQTVRVNQRLNGRRWVYVGTFMLRAGTRAVRVSRRTGTPGWVAADAVKLEPLRPVVASTLAPTLAGWALTGRQLATSPDGGATWTRVTPLGAAATTIRAADFADASTGWAVVLPRGPASGLQLYATRDGGATWTQSRLPMPPDLDAAAPISLDFPDEANGFLALRREEQGTGAGLLLRTGDGGATWRTSRLPVAGTISFPTARIGWLSNAETGELLVTRNAGTTWRPVALPRPVAYRRSVALAALPTLVDPATAILPVTYAGARSAVSFSVSRNGGQSWSPAATIPLARPLVRLRSVPTAVADAGTWLAALDGGRRFVAVREGGLTRAGIAPRTLPFGGTRPPVAALRFATPTTGWAQVDSRCPIFRGRRCPDRQGLYATTDGGRSWRRLSPP